MQEKSLDETKSSYQYSFPIAVVLTVLIIVFAILIWTGVLHIPASPYESSNEQGHVGFSITDFGTYVSGVFTSLSFIWLVVNALQQREDLKLQREEMRENNKYQNDQAKHLSDTAKINNQNLTMQKEIYAIDSIQPNLKRIFHFICINRDHMKIDVSKHYIETIQPYFNFVSLDSPHIYFFPSAYSLNEYNKHSDNESKIVFSYTGAINFFIDNMSKLEKTDYIKSFEKYHGLENLTSLEKQFISFDSQLNWLDKDYANSIRTMYKINEALNCINKLKIMINNFNIEKNKQSPWAG